MAWFSTITPRPPLSTTPSPASSSRGSVARENSLLEKLAPLIEHDTCDAQSLTGIHSSHSEGLHPKPNAQPRVLAGREFGAGMNPPH